MSVHWTSQCAGDHTTPSPSSFATSATTSGSDRIEIPSAMDSAHPMEAAPILAAGRQGRIRPGHESIRLRLPSQRLDGPAPSLLVEAANLRGERRSGRTARLFALLRFRQQRGEPRACVLAVARLAREFLGEDDDDALLRHARAGELHQPDHDVGGEAWAPARVEAQFDRGRDLVDVLPAGTGGADEGFDDLALGNEEIPDFHGSTATPSRRQTGPRSPLRRPSRATRDGCGLYSPGGPRNC